MTKARFKDGSTLMQSSRTDSQKELRLRTPVGVNQMAEWINVDGNIQQSIFINWCRSSINIKIEFFSGVAREY